MTHIPWTTDMSWVEKYWSRFWANSLDLKTLLTTCASPFYFFSVIFDGNMFQTTKQIALDQLLATNTNFCIINIAAELKKK